MGLIRELEQRDASPILTNGLAQRLVRAILLPHSIGDWGGADSFQTSPDSFVFALVVFLDSWRVDASRRGQSNAL